MIRSFLHDLDAARQHTGLSQRRLLSGLPRSTIFRWQSRQRAGVDLIKKPGPRKPCIPNWPQLLQSVKALCHGRQRTFGTTALHAVHREEISRRDLQALVQEERLHQHQTMQRIHWLQPGTAWSIDATAYHSNVIVPLTDLASRYCFSPLLARCQSGAQIADFLDQAFRQHGAPLLLKRDNGSPFNCAEVDQVLDAHKVLPLNSPPHYPPYNGAMEKRIGDFKRSLDKRFPQGIDPSALPSTIEAVTHTFNHQPRRCLHGRTACDVQHDPTLRLSLDSRSRESIFLLLLTNFGRSLQSMATVDHHQAATLWRHTVESWLRCQGLIKVGPNRPPQPYVSTILPTKWSRN